MDGTNYNKRVVWSGPSLHAYTKYRFMKVQSKVRQVEATDLTFGLNLHLHPYFVYACSEGPGETARMRRLVLAFSAYIVYNY